MATVLVAVEFSTASPVQVVQVIKDSAKSVSNAITGRQQTVPGAAAVPAADDDDEDDDDDDDELEGALDDDDGKQISIETLGRAGYFGLTRDETRKAILPRVLRFPVILIDLNSKNV